jgi:hypothetical protein
VFGLSLSVNAFAALIVKTAEADDPESDAVIVDVVSVPTFVAVIVKVALDAPAAIETDAGRVTLVLDDVNATVYPPVGAGETKFTVPVDVVPPVIVDGLSVTLEIPSPVIASDAVAD